MIEGATIFGSISLLLAMVVLSWLYILVTAPLRRRYRRRLSPRSCSPPGCSDASSRPSTVRAYNALKVHSSAMVGEEPEIEVVPI